MENTQKTQPAPVKQLKFLSKKGHKDQIVDLKRKDETTFFSYSDDLTARLWDVRTCAGVKMFSLGPKMESFNVEDGGCIDWIEKYHTLVCSSSNKVNFIFWFFGDSLSSGPLMTESAKYC